MLVIQKIINISINNNNNNDDVVSVIIVDYDLNEGLVTVGNVAQRTCTSLLPHNQKQATSSVE